MRKAIFILLFIFLLTGCAKTPPIAETATIADYFPLKEGTYYEYSTSGLDAGDQQIYVAYKDGNKIQRRLTTGNAIVTEVISYENGELRLVFADPFGYNEKITDAAPRAELLILQEPLKVGTKWNQEANTVSEITALNGTVTTPLGEYKDCLEVTSQLPGIVQKDYYAKGVGLVKSEYNQNGKNISFELKSLTENKELEFPIRLFEPDKSGYSDPAKNGGYKISEHKLILKGGQGFEAQLEELLSPLAPGLKISGIEVDRENKKLILKVASISLPDGVTEEANKNLQCLSNTIGNFYKVYSVEIVTDKDSYFFQVEIEEA